MSFYPQYFFLKKLPLPIIWVITCVYYTRTKGTEIKQNTEAAWHPTASVVFDKHGVNWPQAARLSISHLGRIHSLVSVHAQIRRLPCMKWKSALGSIRDVWKRHHEVAHLPGSSWRPGVSVNIHGEFRELSDSPNQCEWKNSVRFCNSLWSPNVKGN